MSVRISCRIVLVSSAALLVIATTGSCGEAPRPRPVTATSITEGDGTALGSEVEIPLDAAPESPVALRGVVEFKISDPSIVDGRIVPGQGLVLSPKKLGSTGADLTTGDGKHHTVSFVVKKSAKESSAHGQGVIEMHVGEQKRLLEITEQVVDWSSAPPGFAEIVTNADGVFVVARQPGEVTVLIRTPSKPRLVRLYVEGCADCVSLTTSADGGVEAGTKIEKR